MFWNRYKTNQLIIKKHFSEAKQTILFYFFEAKRTCFRAKTFLSKQNEADCYWKCEKKSKKIEFLFFFPRNDKKRMLPYLNSKDLVYTCTPTILSFSVVYIWVWSPEKAEILQTFKLIFFLLNFRLEEMCPRYCVWCQHH